jgi:branched-chain amino acid transport system permease protein
VTHPALIGLAGLAALAVAPLVLAGYQVDLLTELLVWALLAMSLDLVFGYATLASFGHAAFFGAGAYAAAMAVQHGGAGFWTALGAGVAAGCLVGGIMAVFAARSEGVVFIILSVLLSSVLFTLAHVLTGVTGGENGIYLFQRLELWPGVPVRDRTLYWFVLAVTALAVALAWRVVHSPFGRVVLALRENERRTNAMGYNTTAFTIGITLFSATLAGTAGALNVFMNRFVSPESLGVGLSTQVVIWALVGGLGTLVGPMLGAAVLVVLTDLLNRLLAGYVIVVGLIFIATVIFLPGGLISLVPAFRTQALLSLRRRAA